MSYPKLSRVSCKYGAPMGRFSDKTDAATNVSVSRLAMTSDGVYDIGGAYWGDWPVNLSRRLVRL